MADHDDPYRIREAAEADEVRLSHIYHAARAGVFRSSSAQSGVAEFRRQTAGELVLVASDGNGTIQGWMSVWRPESFIHHLYVDPSWQRRGFGRGLLKALPHWLAPPFTLKCIRGNTDAMQFYACLGWTEIGSGDSEDGEYALLEWRPKR